jgi:nicotinamide-nucleotide amidase
MVGDELLDGRSRDTNSEWIIDRGTSERWRVQVVEVLPDDTEVISEAIGRHAGRASAILLSGGLGPTTDDVTRDGLARALGVELFFDDEISTHIESLFRSRGRRMPESNRRQAYRTPASRVIPNPVGSAVGLLEELDGTLIALLPGVPAELKAMFDATVRTEFSTRLAGGAAYSRRIRTAQIAESVLVDLVREAVPEIDTLDTAWCVSTWGVDLLLRDDDESRLEAAAEKISSAIGDFAYGEGQTSLPAAVVQVRGELAESIAVAESCTGGLVGAAITSVPGSSTVFFGGVTAYSDDVKTAMLGVPSTLIARHGAVSEEVADAMAAGVRDRLGTDWGASTTGVAGPGGGTVDKPVGTVCVGLAGPDGLREAATIRLGGDRELVRRWSVAAALDALRRGRIRRR